MGHSFCRPLHWHAAAAVVGILLTAGCAGDGSSSATPTPGEPRPVLIAWSALYLDLVGSYGCDDLRMLQNFFQALGQKQTGLRMRYLDDDACDPRNPPPRCKATEGGSAQAPFFSMIDAVGTLEYGPLSSVDPLTYDVLILDACRTDVAAIKTTLDRFITTATHGGILVLGSNHCKNIYNVFGTMKANILVSSYGIQYSETAAFNQTKCNPIPEEARTGLMQGVASSTLRHTVPLEVSPPARALFTTGDGRPLAAVYERPNP